jgi:hypothetical protein
MKVPFTAIVLALGLSSSPAGDSLFLNESLGKSVLRSNDRLARNWFFEVTSGPVFGVNGDLTRAISDPSGLQLDSQTFGDVFDNAWLLGFRFGKHFGMYDGYMRFAYTQADGGRDQVGTDGSSAVNAVFGNYSDFALLAGVRREFLQPNRLHPYLGFEAGIRFVNGMDISVDSGPTLPFYDDSAVFTTEVTAGVAYDVTNAFRIGLETGLRYQGGLDDINGNLLEDFNTSEYLLFVPIMLTGTLNF